MARAGLMSPLRVAINQAKKQDRPVRRKNARLDDNGRMRWVYLKYPAEKI